jgi:hypothetical protein
MNADAPPIAADDWMSASGIDAHAPQTHADRGLATREHPDFIGGNRRGIGRHRRFQGHSLTVATRAP